jgi:hypothetical protein
MGTTMPGMGYCWLTRCRDMDVRVCQHVQIHPELLPATMPSSFYFWPPSPASTAAVSSLSSSIYSYAKTCIFSPIECVGSRVRKKYIDGNLFHSIKTCGARRLYVYGIGCALLFWFCLQQSFYFL